MSSEDTKILAEIINGILNPDNTLRNKAVEKLESLRQNTPILIYHLFRIIQGKKYFFKIQIFQMKKKLTLSPPFY